MKVCLHIRGRDGRSVRSSPTFGSSPPLPIRLVSGCSTTCSRSDRARRPSARRSPACHASACSYHLRHLERFGLVERADPVDGAGRDGATMAARRPTGSRSGPPQPPRRRDRHGDAGRLSAPASPPHADLARRSWPARDDARGRLAGRRRVRSLRPGRQCRRTAHHRRRASTPSCARTSAVTRTDPPADARPVHVTAAGLPPPVATGRRERPWRQRDFRLIWAGGLVNDTGDWLLMVALPPMSSPRPGRVLTTALLVLAQLVPTALLGSHARQPRRSLGPPPDGGHHQRRPGRRPCCHCSP